jgi:hypothetical protein
VGGWVGRGEGAGVTLPNNPPLMTATRASVQEGGFFLSFVFSLEAAGGTGLWPIPEGPRLHPRIVPSVVYSKD